MSRRAAHSCVVLAVAVLIPGASRAWNERNHDEITRAAVRLLEACRDPGWSGPTAKRASDVLSDCNGAQEGPRQKLCVWHFRSPVAGNSPEHEPTHPARGGVMETTWHGDVGWLSRRLGDSASSGLKRLATLGALPHFVQDATVPAHVAPIFDSGVVFGKDAVDRWPGRPSDFDVEPTKDLCKALRVPTPTPAAARWSALVSDTAEHTLAVLKQSIPGARRNGEPDETLTWSRIWPPADARPASSSYGCGVDRFGVTRFGCYGDAIEIEETVWNDFARALARRAVLQSARAISRFGPTLPQSGDTSAACPLPTQYLAPKRRPRSRDADGLQRAQRR